ncbi:MAG: hypothetical protein NTW86_01000 [Candidatus Sumerlaeota bacterium]|nr:hypothetical protein [Candidatus Sumerlaeota bacterium]
MPFTIQTAPPGTAHPDRGFLCQWTYWRADPDAPDPEMPGLKVQTLAFIPLRPSARCLCRSGAAFEHCCRARPYWQLVCVNPGPPRMQRRGRVASVKADYSLVAPQTARFSPVDGLALRHRLSRDLRFKLSEDSAGRAFWIYWGNPASVGQHGSLCFGDVELVENRELIVTALSAMRMALLLYVLYDLAGSLLTIPRISYDPIEMLDRDTLERVTIPQTPDANPPRPPQKSRAR